MPDPFGVLPAPLPLFILKAIDDFPTLGALLQASAAANAYFQECSNEITESLLRKTPHQLQQLCGVTVLVRSKVSMIEDGLVPGQQLHDFLREQIEDDWLGAQERLVDLGTTSSSALRGFIVSSAHMQPVAAAVLAALTREVVNSEPLQRVERKTIYELRIPWLAPECQSNVPKKSDPLGEAREWRAYRILWRFELYCNIFRLPIGSPIEKMQRLAWESLKNGKQAYIWRNVVDYDRYFCFKADKEFTKGGGISQWQRQDIDDIYIFFSLMNSCYIISGRRLI